MKGERILSIDIFRGITIFLMVFVNDLAGVENIPAWMKHVKAGVDGMTFVDVVFPAFLFIVGMAIPFAVEKRNSKGKSKANFWFHVVIRTLGLLILGIYMVNAEEMNVEANLIPSAIWSVGLYIAAILIWNQYNTKPDGTQKTWVMLLKGLGILMLIALYFLYRKGPDEDLLGMTTSWWGILGLIGWAYFIATILYSLSGGNLLVITGLFSIVLILLLGLLSKWNFSPFDLAWLQHQTGHISHSLIVMTGILSSTLLRISFRGNRKNASRITGILVLGLLLAMLGFCTQEFGGISKIAATPSWFLYSASICCIAFTLIYWIVDVKGKDAWANFLKPAGKNPLLTYVLPYLFYAIAGFSFFPAFLSEVFLGFLKALVFSLLILWVSNRLTKAGISLHL